MKKIVTVFMLLIILFTCALPFFASAENAATVVAQDCSVTQGGYAYMNLRANNFSNVAAIDIDVYYDSDAMSVNSISNQTLLNGATVSTNTSTIGVIKISAVSVTGLNCASSNMMQICFKIDSDTPAGDYAVKVAVGDAYDGDMLPTAISGVTGKITVKEAAQKAFSTSISKNASSFHCNDTVALTIKNSASLPFASADFHIEYDRDLFEFEALELKDALKNSGAVYSINSSIEGLVVLSYASTNAISPYELFTVKLKVVADVDTSTKITVDASDVYDNNLVAYASYSNSTTLTLLKTEAKPDYKNLSLNEQKFIVGESNELVLTLEKGANVAAADFTVNYDAETFDCNGVTATNEVTSLGAMVVINPTYTDGVIKFSFINQSGELLTDLPLMRITLTPKRTPETHYNISVNGSDVCDINLKDVPLEYIGLSGCIHKSRIVEPTCTDIGYTIFECGCGDYYIVDEVPALGHDEINHEARSETCTEIGWDDYVTCSRCDYTTYEEIPALGHDEINHQARTETCTEIGWDEYVTCSRCDYTTYEEIPALGHDKINHEARAETCTKIGWDEYVTCSRCDYTTYNEIPALGHSYMNKICLRCGEDQLPTNTWDISLDSNGSVVANAYKHVNGSYLLEIVGNGPIKDFSSSPFSAIPANKIDNICIFEGITSLGNSLFEHISIQGDISIPESIVSIGDSTFYGFSGPKIITLPSSVDSIGNFAFYGAKNATIILKGDTLPSNLGSIWDYNCGHYLNPQQIIITEDATYIIDRDGKAWLAKCYKDTTQFEAEASVNGITVTGIGAFAFDGKSNMELYYVPKEITTFGQYAFRECRNLTLIFESSSLPSGYSHNSYSDPPYYLAPQKIIKTLDSLYVIDKNGEMYFARYLGTAKNFTVELEMDGILVQHIGNFAFSSKSVDTIHLPNTIKTIGDYAFMHSSIKHIELPASLEKIGLWSFFSADLKSITIPENVISIGSSAFSYCELLNVVYVNSPIIAKNINSISSFGDLCQYASTVVIPANIENHWLAETYTYQEIAHAINTDLLIYSNCIHNWQENIITEMVICHTDGIIEHTCNDCGVTWNEIIPCHNKIQHSAQAPTCTEIGWTEYDTCSNCDYTTYEELPALGHDEINHEARSETCTEIGWHKYVSCSRCDYTTYEEIPATGHIYYNACDFDCNVCGEIREVPNHIYDNACDTNCNICSEQREVPDHVYDNSCDTTCNVCGDVRNITHHFEWVVDKENNCGVNGIKHQECTVCHTIQNANTIIPATQEHTYTNNCDADCNVCNQVRIPAEHIYDDACDTTCNECGKYREITHNFEWVVDKENNCGVNGSKHQECTVCHTIQNANTIIPATGNHIHDNACDDNCNICGQVREVPDHVYDNSCDTTCNICGQVRDIIHKFEWVIDKENNCGIDGSKHQECTVCHTIQNANTVIPATGNHTHDNPCDTTCNVCGAVRDITHNFEWVIDKENNCGVNGSKHQECTVCHSIQNANTVIPATGNHSHDNPCGTTCKVCGAVRDITHHFEWVIDKVNNCGVDGSKHQECTVCHTIQNADTVIPATQEHTYTKSEAKRS